MTFETDFQSFHPFFRYPVVFTISHLNFHSKSVEKNELKLPQKKEQSREGLTLINECSEILVRISKEEKEKKIKLNFNSNVDGIKFDYSIVW